MPYCVYRIFDKDGTLLYVGVSREPLRRLQQHKSKKVKWFRFIARIDFEWHLDRVSANKAETEAIEKEAPSYNRNKRCASGSDLERLFARGIWRGI